MKKHVHVKLKYFATGLLLNVAFAHAGDISLNQWAITLPVDDDRSGKADMIKEYDLAKGFEYPPYFVKQPDGSLIFRSPVSGARTPNTTYTRSELRSMLRCGNKHIKTQGVTLNNWVFSSAPKEDIQQAGGVDGRLEATLAVNHVTTTGKRKQVGRVVIGQIHATRSEPIRVHYRKLPNHQRGSLYLAHENTRGYTRWFDVVGSRKDHAPEPKDGIALNETFSYKIIVEGNLLTFQLLREGKAPREQTIDMTDSGYDRGGEYMYFKAGVYNLNKSGDAQDYTQATFSQISTHYAQRRPADACQSLAD